MPALRACFGLPLAACCAMLAPFVAAQPTNEPIDVIIGDIDLNGWPDVVSANRYSETVALRRNPGTGVMLAPISVLLAPLNLRPNALSRGDLDGDGRADDCAVACSNTDTVALVFDVAASPSIVTVPAIGNQPRDVVVAELDGAPPAEVVFGCEGDGLGGGEGLELIPGGSSTAVAIAMPAGFPTKVIRIAAHDLDGDGAVDLAVAVAGSGTVRDSLLLFQNDGQGGYGFVGFLPQPSIGLITSLAGRDLDGNGRVDLAVLLRNGTPTANLLRIHRNIGSGALDPADFTLVEAPSPGRGGLDVALGDLDGDGAGDAVVINAATRDIVAHDDFSASGFAGVRNLGTVARPVAVTMGDLNGDGNDDLAVADGVAETVVVLRSPGPLSPAIQVLGAGCPGTGGLVPQIAAPVLPTAGEPAFAVNLDDALPGSVAVLFLATADAALPLPGGCTLWLLPPLFQVAIPTSPTGTAGLSFGIPNTASVMGAELSLQWAVADPGGAFLAALAFSGGVQARIGS